MDILIWTAKMSVSFIYYITKTYSLRNASDSLLGNSFGMHPEKAFWNGYKLHHEKFAFNHVHSSKTDQHLILPSLIRPITFLLYWQLRMIGSREVFPRAICRQVSLLVFLVQIHEENLTLSLTHVHSFYLFLFIL